MSELTEYQKEILLKWYKRLDDDYGEHGKEEDGCPICYEALQLGLIGEKEQDNE